MIICENKVYTKDNYNDLNMHIDKNYSITEADLINLINIESQFQAIKESLYQMELCTLTESVQVITEGAVWDKIKEAISNFGKSIMNILSRIKNWFLGLFKKADTKENKEKVENGKKAAKEKKLTPEQEAKLNEVSADTKGYKYETSLDFTLNPHGNAILKFKEAFKSNSSLEQGWVANTLKDYKNDLIKSFIKNNRTSFADDEINDPRSVFILYLRGEKIDNIYKYYLENDILSAMKEVYQKNLQTIDSVKAKIEEIVKKDTEYVESHRSKDMAEDKIKFLSDFVQTTQVFYNKAVSEQLKACQAAMKQVEKAENFFAGVSGTSNPESKDKENGEPKAKEEWKDTEETRKKTKDMQDRMKKAADDIKNRQNK